MDREIRRFVLAGTANTAASYLLYLLLLPVVPCAVSYTLAFAGGVVLSYVLNARWVFRVSAGPGAALRWPVVCLVQYLLGAGLLCLAVDILGIDPRVAPLPAVALTVPVTFLLSRRILQGRQRRTPAFPAAGWGHHGGIRNAAASGAAGRFLVNGGLLAVGTIAAVLLAEGALRLAGYAHLLGRESRAPAHYFVADRENGYDIGPNRGTAVFDFRASSHPIWSNELGCFDRPYGGENPFILLLGDSTSWGYKELEKTWGSVVERETGVRVLQCAVPGYGTKHEVLKGRKLLSALGRSPSLILVGHCANDHLDDHLHPYRTVVDGRLLQCRSITDAYTGSVREKTEDQLRRELRLWEKYGVPYEPRHPMLLDIKRFLNRHSVVYRMVQPPLERVLRATALGRHAISVVMEPAAEADRSYRELLYARDRFPWLEQAWQYHFQNLRDLRRLADEHGAALLIVVLPTREQVYESSPAEELLANHERLLAFLRQERIPFLDLLGPFQHVALRAPVREGQRVALFWRGDSHAAPAGDRLIGLQVARRLIGEGLIDVPDPQGRLGRIDRALRECCGMTP
ncbi:MAG: GtrA-like protein [Syntrophaceae bacterium PtaU1.Bin231]|nr:MAG: GtrA-like protein [Syntrophaceae bacterium PtaU1.Bin231]